MSSFSVVGYCLTAFGIGYAAGALLRIAQRAIEVLD